MSSLRRFLADAAGDARRAVRALAANRGFAAAAILSLALGMGANTAIFSVVNALLLRPVPYADADRLTVLWNRSPGLGIAEDWFSTAQYFDIKNGHSGFEQLGHGHRHDGQPDRRWRAGARRRRARVVVSPADAGRDGCARPAVHAGGRHGRAAAATAVLTHGMWMRRYGGRPGIVGRSITLNGQPFEVVGVLPASFSLPREVRAAALRRRGDRGVPAAAAQRRSSADARTARTTTSSAS